MYQSLSWHTTHLSLTPAQCHYPPEPAHLFEQQTLHMPHLKKKTKTKKLNFVSSHVCSRIEVLSVTDITPIQTISLHTLSHADTADVLLSQKVPDLHQRAALLDHHVNGEMGIYRSHLVSEALKNKRNMHFITVHIVTFSKELGRE